MLSTGEQRLAQPGAEPPSSSSSRMLVSSWRTSCSSWKPFRGEPIPHAKGPNVKDGRTLIFLPREETRQQRGFQYHLRFGSELD